MTDQEVAPFIGKAVRVTLADGRVIAGTLHADASLGAHGHGHGHYAVVSDPVKEGDERVSEVLHGADIITDIEDASGDPAAVE
jgi:hypothetical protein